MTSLNKSHPVFITSGGLGDLVEDAVRLDYEDIPAFPVSSAPGHNGVLILGMLAGAPVVLMQVY